MRVLVTGIDGFVGSHLAEYLLGIPGVEVHGTVVVPGGGPAIAAIAPRLHLHRADILDAARMQTLVADLRPDRIIHLAAQAYIPASVADPSGTFQANIAGGISVLEAARAFRTTGEHGVAVLMISSGEVYGRVEVDRQPITEEHPLQPGNPYAVSKACIDLIAQEYARGFDVDVTIARPFNHAGPRQSPTFVVSDFGRQFAAIAAGKAPPVLHVGNLDVSRDFTDVRDVVRAYWSLFYRSGRERVFNVCSERPVTIRAVVELLQQACDVPVEIMPDPGRMRRYDIPTVVCSAARLRAATGWNPAVPLRQTIADVFTYWRHNLP